MFDHSSEGGLALCQLGLEDAHWFAHQMAAPGPDVPPGGGAEDEAESAAADARAAARVLVVDDHLDTCFALRRLLQRNGYDVECAHTGTAALAAMRRRVPSLVILDQMMPEMSGVQVLREMRASDPLKPVPVLVFSGVGNPDEALDAGATEFLSKPKAFDGIIARVKRYIG